MRRRRKLSGVWAKIGKRARELGRPRLRAGWSPKELEIVDRYVREFATGRFRTADEAAKLAVIDIEQLHRRHPETLWSRIERTPVATADRIGMRARLAGVRLPFARRAR